jgi:hypothetical protein
MISFGKITEQQRQELSQLTSVMTELDRNMKEIINLQAKTRYAINEFWHKIGIEHGIDTMTISYMIDKDGEIVLYGG